MPCQLINAAIQWAKRPYGNLPVSHVVVHFVGGCKASVPACVQEGNQDEDSDGGWSPNDFQLKIITALEGGRQLRTDGLAAAVGDRRRLFRNPGGLKELIEHKIVGHQKGIGYFLIDESLEEASK